MKNSYEYETGKLKTAKPVHGSMKQWMGGYKSDSMYCSSFESYHFSEFVMALGQSSSEVRGNRDSSDGLQQISKQQTSRINKIQPPQTSR
jgi:hypothetical protein